MGEIVEIDNYRRPTLKEPSVEVLLPINEAQVALWGYNKVAIVGGPGTGKTFLANKIAHNDAARKPLPRVVYCSDVLWNVEWKEQPSFAANSLDHGPRGTYVAEGIAILRALRLGLIKPDAVVYRDLVFRPLGQAQANLTYQCKRWWAEIEKKWPVYRIVPQEMIK